jgi:HEAT repeat protein
MALGKIGDARASHPILQYVLQDSNLDTRGAGIYAIGEIADQSIRDELKLYAEVEENPQLKQLANEALIKIATRQPPPNQKESTGFPTALEAALATDDKKNQ